MDVSAQIRAACGVFLISCRKPASFSHLMNLLPKAIAHGSSRAGIFSLPSDTWTEVTLQPRPAAENGAACTENHAALKPRGTSAGTLSTFQPWTNPGKHVVSFCKPRKQLARMQSWGIPVDFSATHGSYTSLEKTGFQSSLSHVGQGIAEVQSVVTKEIVHELQCFVFAPWELVPSLVQWAKACCNTQNWSRAPGNQKKAATAVLQNCSRPRALVATQQVSSSADTFWSDAFVSAEASHLNLCVLAESCFASKGRGLQDSIQDTALLRLALLWVLQAFVWRPLWENWVNLAARSAGSAGSA